MGTIEIIEDSDGCTPLDEDMRERLELLGIPMVFDFSLGELIFEISKDEIVIFDFEEFTIHEMDKESFFSNYLSSINQVSQYYLEELQLIETQIQTDIVIFGEGYFQHLAIKIHNNYVIIGQILIDIEDTPPDDDPDGGEPIPEVGDFLIYNTLSLQYFINHRVLISKISD